MKKIDGMYVRREGKCIDCGAKVWILEDGTAQGKRTACNCPPSTYREPQDQAYKAWIEGMKQGTK